MKNITLSLLFVITILFVSEYSFAKENKYTIDIIYFHATLRCQTCLSIEEFIKKSVELSFEKELKDSTLTLKSLDFLQSENEHYQEKYKFDTQTLTLSKKLNGNEVKWKNLDKIWDYVNDFEKFKKYIKKEIKYFRRLK